MPHFRIMWQEHPNHANITNRVEKDVKTPIKNHEIGIPVVTDIPVFTKYIYKVLVVLIKRDDMFILGLQLNQNQVALLQIACG